MAIIPIDNQAIKFYTPTENTVRQQQNICGYLRQNFCIVAQQDDPYSFQVNLTNDSRVGWRIVNCDTDEVVFEDAAGENVLYNEAGTKAQVNIIWGDGNAYSYGSLADGCYKIELFDLKTALSYTVGNDVLPPTVNPPNIISWAPTGDFSIVGSKIKFEDNTANGVSDVFVGTGYFVGASIGIYRLTFDITGILHATDRIDFYICSELIASFNTTGTHTVDFSYGNGGECSPNEMTPGFEFISDGTASGDIGFIENISIKKLTFDFTASTEELVTNGGFANSSFWSVNGSWSIGSGVASSTLVYGGMDTDGLKQALGELLPSTRYKITFTLAGTLQLGSYVKVLIDNTTVYNIFGIGTHELYFDTDTNIGTPYIEFRSVAAGDNISITLDNVSVNQNFIDSSFNSDCFCLQSSQPCSHLITWTNTESAFGFDYENFYFPQCLRVRAKIAKGIHEVDKEMFRYSTGAFKVLFARTKKISELWIDEQPEFIHDALAKALCHDTFSIDGVEYVNEDGYEPDWAENLLLAQAKIPIIKKDAGNTETNSFI